MPGDDLPGDEPGDDLPGDDLPGDDLPGDDLPGDDLPAVVAELKAQIAVLERSRDQLQDRLVCLAEELEQTRTALGNAATRTEELLSLLAHELRSPLAPLLHGTQVILSSEDHAMVAEARGIVQKQVRRMARLIGHLLDVARISAGRITLHRCAVDLNEVLESATRSTRPLFEDSGVHLVVSLPDAPLLVDADVNRLSQLVTHLLEHAVTSTEAADEVHLAACRQGEQAITTVSDSGGGIATEELPHIFDLFACSRPGRAGQCGLGMELALAQELARLHGGQIRVQSGGPGRGRRFEVQLPLLQPCATPHAEALPAEPVVDPPGGRRLRVVVVDDSQDSAAALGRLLELLGHEVHLAFDGCEGLETCRRVRPDAAILDIDMQGLDGCEVAHELRLDSGTRHALLVALTGLDHEADRGRALAAGFDHHMVKPADPSELQQLLTQHPRHRGP